MKKVLVVLLVAVMAITSAFAEMTVSGSVAAKLSYDLNDGYFAYYDPATDGNTVKAKFEFKEALNASASGALKPYVDVALSATIKIDKNFANESVAFDLDTFKIVGNKWVLDFIPDYQPTDLATDVIDGRYVLNEDLDDYAFNPYTYSWAITTDTAMSFQYDGIGTLTVGADRYKTAAGTDSTRTILYMTEEEWDDIDPVAGVEYSYAAAGLANPVRNSICDFVINDDGDVVPVYAVVKTTAPAEATRGADFAIAFESEDIALVDADKLVFKGAVGYSYGWNAITKKNQYDFGASAKASYMDYVTVAADMGFVNADFFDADIAAHVAYAPVTFDAYWATNADVFAFDPEDGQIGVAKKDLISLKAVADVEEINTKFTATASDIAQKATNNISVEAENTSIENFKFTLGLTDLAHKKGIGIKAGVEATLSEDLKATANFKCKLQKGANAEFKASVDYTGIENLTLSAAGKITTGKKTFFKSVELNGSALYEAALFDAEFDAYYSKYVAEDFETYPAKFNGTTDKPSLTGPATPGLVLAFDLSSDKIVDGATLDFKWQSGQLSDKNGAKGDFGKLTASCTVEF